MTDGSRSHLDVQEPGPAAGRTVGPGRLILEPPHPATCRKCGHPFLSFQVLVVDGQQSLVDLDGNVVYELVLVCKYCKEPYSWHTSYKAMVRHSEAMERLIASVRKMWENDRKGDTNAQEADV